MDMELARLTMLSMKFLQRILSNSGTMLEFIDDALGGSGKEDDCGLPNVAEQN